MAKRLFYLDGNNIGCWLDNKNIKQEKPKEKNKISDDEKPEIRMAILLTLCNELIKRGDNFICFFDANIQYIIKEKEFETVLFRFLDNKEKCKIVPGQSQADSFILPLANREKASVISNDIFKHSIKKYPWLKKNAKPQRLFKGMATETSLKEAKLLIPDLDIEIPIETDIPKLLRELGVSKSDPGGGGDGNEEDEETGTGDTEQKRIEEKRRKKEEEERKRQAEIKRLEEQKRKEEEERRKQEEEKKRREEQEKRKLLFIFAFIFLIVILFYNLSSNDKTGSVSEGNTTQETSTESVNEAPKQTAPRNKDCEINNSGAVTFRNTSPHTMHVSVSIMAVTVEIIEIPAKNSHTFHFTAYPNDEYSYTASSEFASSELTGSFILNTCASKTIILTQPDAEYYSIRMNYWKEVLFDEDGVYTIFVPSGEFYYKYETSDKIYSGFNRYTQRVHKGDKIYFATPKQEGDKLGISKANPRSGEEVAEVPDPQPSKTKPGQSEPIYDGNQDVPSLVPDIEQTSTYQQLNGTIGQLQVSCTLVISPDKVVKCDCNPGTNFDPPIYFQGSVAPNGTLRLGHYVNGAAVDYVTLKVKNGCYSGKSIGANGFYFIQLCP